MEKIVRESSPTISHAFVHGIQIKKSTLFPNDISSSVVFFINLK